MSKKTKEAQASQAQFLRWNLTMAAREFGVGYTAIQKGVANTGAAPDADGFFTTAQIVGAIYGDRKKEEAALMAARKRKLTAQAESAEMDLKHRVHTLVPVKEFAAMLTPACDAMRSRILGSRLPEEERRSLLDDLGKLLYDALTAQFPRDEPLAEPSAESQPGAPVPTETGPGKPRGH